MRDLPNRESSTLALFSAAPVFLSTYRQKRQPNENHRQSGAARVSAIRNRRSGLATVIAEDGAGNKIMNIRVIGGLVCFSSHQIRIAISPL